MPRSKIIGPQGNLGRRNLAHNGDMQLAQRSTSVNNITVAGYYTCDRWRTAMSSAGTWTQTQETLAVTDPPFITNGHTKALKLDCTTANGSLSASSHLQIQYRVEGFDLQKLRTGTSDPSTMTISFWIKATKTGTNVFSVYQDEGGKQVGFAYTINASNTWEFKSITIPGNTHDAIANDHTRGRQFTWYFAAGSQRTTGSLQSAWTNYSAGDEAPGQVNHADDAANNIHITGVQIEQGSLATDFEHISRAESLLNCQRYYSRIEYNIQGYPPINGYADENMHWPVTMRTTPSITRTGGTLGGTNGIVGTQTYNITNEGCRAELQGNSNFGRMYEFAGVITADAEV
tara:strand:+ start:194 stop:1228 length:1035 start_codon:yes stop_codon:yes gene_type:complete